MRSPRNSGSRAPKGLTLIEIVVGLAVLSALVIVFGVTSVAAVRARQAQYRSMAAAIADEELSELRTMSGSALAQQSSGPILSLLFSQGTWKTAADAAAVSGSNTFETSGSGTGITSVMPLPKDAYDDFTLQASVKVVGGSPAGWQAGFLFRAADLQEHYQVYLTSGSLVLKKVVSGVSTTLYSDVRTVPTDTWETLGVTASGSSISVYLNGALVTTQNDTAFSVGQAALAAWNGATVRFDDVSIGGTTWDFDTTAVGKIDDDWLRFGLSDLPSGTAMLTISQPYAGVVSIKKYTVTITWVDPQGTKSISETTAISTN